MENKVMKPEKMQERSTLFLPFLIALIGVLIVGISLFLPYISATGNMAEYIERYPDKVEIEEFSLTAGDLANIPVISVNKILSGVYGKAEGTLANVIVLVFGGLMALTGLFVILKKPIAIIIFDLLACGVFCFLNFVMREDGFIAEDKYAWGIGYYTIIIATVAILGGAMWLLITKMRLKREAKESITNSME